MLKKTNLEEVKEIAKQFLMLDINVDERLAFIAHHPYTNSSYYSDGEKILNLSEKEDLLIFRDIISKRIEKIDSYIILSYLINKPFRSAFLKYTLPYINKNDLSLYLSDLWVCTETPNIDVNISKDEYVSLFKKADKKILMNEREYLVFTDLPEEITIFRGIQDKTIQSAKALSWTLDFEMAKWFANRFNSDGEVYKTTINKEDVLAYFEREKEVVVNYKKIKKIEKAS